VSAAFIPPIAALQEPSLAPSMQINGLQGLGAAGVGASSVGASVGASAPSFGGMVTDGLQQVSAQLQASQADLQTLATGNVENLHQVMLRLEESRMSFQLMLQVRNRLLESYQDLMRMQV
jgi:flagellar hook-basal body complex protein FliE